ncbi:hypothetical protein SERLADRAFT_475201, partial [Serpula lacrymans var. lacrymans S7.9]
MATALKDVTLTGVLPNTFGLNQDDVLDEFYEKAGSSISLISSLMLGVLDCLIAFAGSFCMMVNILNWKFISSKCMVYCFFEPRRQFQFPSEDNLTAFLTAYEGGSSVVVNRGH